MVIMVVPPKYCGFSHGRISSVYTSQAIYKQDMTFPLVNHNAIYRDKDFID